MSAATNLCGLTYIIFATNMRCIYLLKVNVGLGFSAMYAVPDLVGLRPLDNIVSLIPENERQHGHIHKHTYIKV